MEAYITGMAMCITEDSSVIHYSPNAVAATLQMLELDAIFLFAHKPNMWSAVCLARRFDFILSLATSSL